MQPIQHVSQHGFTLTETLVVITIVSILMGIGVPSYKYVTTSNRMSSEVNGLLGDLQFARSQAIREGQSVTACVSTDGQTCSGGTAWQNGWIVFSDVNGNGAVDAPPDVVARVQRPFSGADDFQSSVSLVTFNREGFTAALPAGGIVFTLHNATAGFNANYTRCLAVAKAGMAATTTPSHSLTWAPACT